ncbi:MAG: acetyl/propionyl/methylcrotonyl-CoA carboxylase subunit alpha [Hydrogenophilus sp.]|nr:acetyl/propionyl/methylcrotonyl-CoA carboxylase subunit alpha [Hydrogenophilus sp.]
MFGKILVANRGEIACRVIATARRMGIRTVAVFSEADSRARHVQLADEAVPIGPAPARDSYLVAERIVEACRTTGAEAVHPGYGFLSENELFAKLLEENGIVFIGPKASAIAAMGDKIAAKRLAEAAGVNTIPGHLEPIPSAEEAVAVARAIGYPVMIKASAGGGGKGLRIARNDAECREGFVSCQNEARNAFGDERVFIEKFIEKPRHIEVQVLADAYGNCLYLFERECSIQRRHQKLVEEAPSPFVTPEMRRAMGEQAVRLAKAVNYQSAGTVEFVVGGDRSFYFLEMNTRLQVEHPVTEMITGIDLVEWMIRIAAGERLTLRQEDLTIHGWAIECRINAEDPTRGFLPSVGRLVRFDPPEPIPGAVRVDCGVEEGGEISVFYDSMIAKVITHGQTRAEAIERMRTALDGFVVRGVATNVAFQAAVMAHPRFQRGDLSTEFVAEEFPGGFSPSGVAVEDPVALRAVAAVLWWREEQTAGSMRAGGAVGWEGRNRGAYSEGNPGFAPPRKIVIFDEEDVHRRRKVQEGTLKGEALGVSAEVEALSASRFTVHVGGHGVEVEIPASWHWGRIRLPAVVADHSLVLQVERAGEWMVLRHRGGVVRLQVLPIEAAPLWRWMPVREAEDRSRLLLSPMPGLLREISVRVGQAVKAGERLAVIEAMKMENVLRAERDGVVKAIVAVPGSSVAVDQVILEFE